MKLTCYWPILWQNETEEWLDPESNSTSLWITSRLDNLHGSAVLRVRTTQSCQAQINGSVSRRPCWTLEYFQSNLISLLQSFMPSNATLFFFFSSFFFSSLFSQFSHFPLALLIYFSFISRISAYLNVPSPIYIRAGLFHLVR